MAVLFIFIRRMPFLASNLALPGINQEGLPGINQEGQELTPYRRYCFLLNINNS